ncbi:cytochrome c peroxidase [Xanthobacter sp. KR7-225]|uniref:cytochrome-c peroxidase n=1 Tax=Xanthobacter sp. KR7-225 TaxID=3156613 RepID=UPI0032B44A00
MACPHRRGRGAAAGKVLHAGAVLCALLAPLTGGSAGAGETATQGIATQGMATPEALGEALFFDTTLSKNRTQACASCHAPDAAFTDPREGPAGHAVSVGDDGRSLGDRNAPSATYARFSPAFGRSARPGRYRGGLFHDGRATSLEEQAGGPPLNPAEMAMGSKAEVVARLKENPHYVAAFERLYGKAVFTSDGRAFAAMTRAIAAFERTEAFAPFDSKYDRYLKGEATLTDQEELGRVLFFSKQFTNCALCHQRNAQGGTPGETFTNYEFHNIGVPENPALAAAGAVAAPDLGLARNPKVKDKAAQAGRFKVPSLRNVAVTGPYMHNGVFQDLRTAVLFYNTFNTTNPARKTNPETGAPFGPPEVPGTLSLKELETGPALDDRRIDALVAFLETLTDRRYEPLVAERRAARAAALAAAKAAAPQTLAPQSPAPRAAAAH